MPSTYNIKKNNRLFTISTITNEYSNKLPSSEQVAIRNFVDQHAAVTGLKYDSDDSWTEYLDFNIIKVNGITLPRLVNAATVPTWTTELFSAQRGAARTGDTATVANCSSFTIQNRYTDIYISAGSTTRSYSRGDLRACVPEVLMLLIQAAGGGGGGNLTTNYKGGGGGAGRFGVYMVKIPAGATLTVNLGAGGGGGVSNHDLDEAQGQQGGTTTVSLTLADGTTVANIISVAGGYGGGAGTTSARGSGGTYGPSSTVKPAYVYRYYQTTTRGSGGIGGGSSSTQYAGQGQKVISSSVWMGCTNRFSVSDATSDNSIAKFFEYSNPSYTDGYIYGGQGGSAMCKNADSNAGNWESSGEAVYDAYSGCGGYAANYDLHHYGQDGGGAKVWVYF